MSALSRASAVMAVGWLVLAVHASAQACTLDRDGVPGVHDISVKNEIAPDILLSNFAAKGTSRYLCTKDEIARMGFQPAFVGLRFVRDVEIEGRRYAAYELSATSPLVIFRVGHWAWGGKHHLQPIVAERVTEWRAAVGTNGSLTLSIELAIVSRGGVMSSVAQRSLGGGSIRPLDYAVQKASHQLSLGITVPAVACTLSDASLVLGAATAAQFGGAGSAAGEKPLALRMNCPVAGMRVALEISDSVTPGNKGDTLTPTAASRAAGVALQLLYNGKVIKLRDRFDHGSAQAGNQVLPLSARYVRTAAAWRPGDILGEAVVTATYQ